MVQSAPISAQSTHQTTEGNNIAHEIRYYIPKADTVYLVWGINGWKLVPEAGQCEGTKRIDGLMSTPMARQGNMFVSAVYVPQGTTIDYVFRVRKIVNGKARDIWDTNGGPGIDYHTAAEPHGITVVNATRTTRREIVAKRPDRKTLWPGIIFSVGGIAILFGTTLVWRRTKYNESWAESLVCLWKLGCQNQIFVILPLAAGLYIAAMNFDLYLWGDNAHFIIIGKSIATGQGFKDINYPSSPLFSYPVPLFPIFLSPIIYFFGYNLLPLKLAVSMLCVGVVYLVYHCSRNLLNNSMLFVLVLLVAVSPQIVSFSHQVMSEILFLFLVLLSFVPSHKYFKEKARWLTKSGCISALVISAALLTRTLAVALVLAAIIYLLRDAPLGKWLAIKKAAFLFAVSIIMWAVFNYPVLGQLTYQEEIVGPSAAISANSASPWDIKEIALRVESNGAAYLKVLPETIFYQMSRTPLTFAVVCSVVLVAVGFGYAFVKQRTIFDYFMIGYLVILLLWKPICMNWGNYQRYFVPLIPFLLYYFILGVIKSAILIAGLVNFTRYRVKPDRSLGDALSSSQGANRIFMYAFYLLISLNFWSTIQFSVLKSQPEMFDYYGYNNGWKEYRYMGQWAKDNISPNAVIMVRNSYMLHFWSEKLTTVYPHDLSNTPEEEIIQRLVGTNATHIALDTLRHMYISPSDQVIRKVVEQNSETFELVYQDGANEIFCILPNLNL